MIVVQTGNWTLDWMDPSTACGYHQRANSERGASFVNSPRTGLAKAKKHKDRPPSNQQREEDSPQSSARPRAVLRNVVASLARRLAPAPIGTRRRNFHHGGLRVHKGTSDICVLRSLRIRRPGLVCVGWWSGVLERVWASQGKDGKSVRLLLVLRT